MPGLDVHKLLTAEHLAELEVYARHPARTIDQCRAWIVAKGYSSISRSAVYNFKKHLARSDRLAASAESARALLEAVKEGGTAAVADAAILQLAGIIFEKTIALQEGGRVEVKALASLAASLKDIVMTKRFIEKLREEVNAAMEAERRKGATGEQVMAKVRLILGMPDQTQTPAKPEKDER